MRTLLAVAAALLAPVAAARGRGGYHLAGLPSVVPSWPPTYVMNLSTIAMPCNDSGLFDPALAGTFGTIDYDWSNGAPCAALGSLAH